MDLSEVEKFEKTTVEPWRLELLEAARLIERHGWYGATITYGPDYSLTPHCASNAISFANGFMREAESQWRLAAALGYSGINWSSALQTIWDWNDARGQTANEVTAKLREVAQS